MPFVQPARRTETSVCTPNHPCQCPDTTDFSKTHRKRTRVSRKGPRQHSWLCCRARVHGFLPDGTSLPIASGLLIDCSIRVGLFGSLFLFVPTGGSMCNWLCSRWLLLTCGLGLSCFSGWCISSPEVTLLGSVWHFVIGLLLAFFKL